MKIIERAEKPTWCKQYRCTGMGNNGHGCNSLLEMTPDDLVHFMGSGTGNGWAASEPAVSFKCPVCGTATDIPKEDWPNTTNIRKVKSNWYRNR